MTDQQHPIIPPPDLVTSWIDSDEGGPGAIRRIVTRAVQWGADQELEACVDWVEINCPHYERSYEQLRIARRPKSLSLVEVALEEVQMACNTRDISMVNFDTIRRALERLQQLECLQQLEEQQ